MVVETKKQQSWGWSELEAVSTHGNLVDIDLISSRIFGHLQQILRHAHGWHEPFTERPGTGDFFSNVNIVFVRFFFAKELSKFY